MENYEMKHLLPLILAITTATVSVADWPRWHGPNSDNVSPDIGLLKTWPEGGPLRIWEAAGIGEGYSSPSIANDIIYTSGAVGEKCVITALNRAGEIVWQEQNGPAWEGSYPGTRSTPTIADGLLYHLSGNGNLICLNADNGEKVWSVNILEEFDGRNIRWGLSESLLVFDDKVICSPGGEDVGMVALHKMTGDVVWKSAGSSKDGPGYASPILVNYQGLEQVVMPMSESIVGIRASDGELLWRYPHKVYTDQNITTPLFQDGFVIISACGRQGTTSLKLQVSGDQCDVEQHWLNETLDDKQGGIILVDGRLYGYAESQNRTEPWMCIDFESGETIFQSAPIASSYKYRNGSLTYADGMFYLFTDDGNLALAKPGDTGFELAGMLNIEEPGKNPTWAHPVVFGGRLYLRYGDKLGVFDVAKGN
jgi:outer membrane protein assembly factor BamB